jgi:hypothetical protein
VPASPHADAEHVADLDPGAGRVGRRRSRRRRGAAEQDQDSQRDRGGRSHCACRSARELTGATPALLTRPRRATALPRHFGNLVASRPRLGVESIRHSPQMHRELVELVSKIISHCPDLARRAGGAKPNPQLRRLPPRGLALDGGELRIGTSRADSRSDKTRSVKFPGESPRQRGFKGVARRARCSSARSVSLPARRSPRRVVR